MALLFQALAPAPAMAAAGGSPLTLQICTHDGVKTILAPQDQAPPAAQTCCGHCVMTLAMDIPASLAGLPVLYVRSEQVQGAAAVTPSVRPRAPPRPPSQGPPQAV